MRAATKMVYIPIISLALSPVFLAQAVKAKSETAAPSDRDSRLAGEPRRSTPLAGRMGAADTTDNPSSPHKGQRRGSHDSENTVQPTVGPATALMKLSNNTINAKVTNEGGRNILTVEGRLPVECAKGTRLNVLKGNKTANIEIEVPNECIEAASNKGSIRNLMDSPSQSVSSLILLENGIPTRKVDLGPANPSEDVIGNLAAQLEKADSQKAAQMESECDCYENAPSIPGPASDDSLFKQITNFRNIVETLPDLGGAATGYPGGPALTQSLELELHNFLATLPKEWEGNRKELQKVLLRNVENFLSKLAEDKARDSGKTRLRRAADFLMDESGALLRNVVNGGDLTDKEMTALSQSPVNTKSKVPGAATSSETSSPGYVLSETAIDLLDQTTKQTKSISDRDRKSLLAFIKSFKLNYSMMATLAYENLISLGPQHTIGLTHQSGTSNDRRAEVSYTHCDESLALNSSSKGASQNDCTIERKVAVNLQGNLPKGNGTVKVEGYASQAPQVNTVNKPEKPEFGGTVNWVVHFR